jgi:hypothetical protein
VPRSVSVRSAVRSLLIRSSGLFFHMGGRLWFFFCPLEESCIYESLRVPHSILSRKRILSVGSGGSPPLCGVSDDFDT